MDITRFINSKSIAKYLKDINYEFNALEAAYLIWQCKIATISEKFSAWQEIIETMPDMPVKKRRWGWLTDEPSLHAFLKRYIQLQKRYVERFYDNDLDEEENDLALYFEGLWFKFPTPFKRGDIVYQPNRYERKPDPFVLLSMCTWGEEELRKYGYKNEEEIMQLNRLVKIHEQVGDESDMIVSGYFMDDNGRLYRDHTTDSYLNLEYYDGELEGKNRFLTALSDYEKKKIDIALLVNAYKIFCWRSEWRKRF